MDVLWLVFKLCAGVIGVVFFVSKVQFFMGKPTLLETHFSKWFK